MKVNIMKRIFIETRNKSVDYDWFNAENSKLESPNIPDLVKKLVDTEFESLILYRESRQLILVVTALKSGERFDNRTRQIFNSLIWIADDSEEAKLRSIIIEYLEDKGKLETQIADAITEKPEIKIDYKKIEAIGKNTNVESDPLDSSKLVYKIGNLNNYNCKKELSHEIKSYSLPEKKDGLLIFITYNKSEVNVKKENPWRGLSTDSKSDKLTEFSSVENGKKTKKSTSQISPKSLKDSSEKSLENNNTGSRQFNPFVIFLIGLVIGLVIALFFIPSQNDQLKQENNQLKQEYDKLEQENNQLKQKNNQLEQKNKELKEILNNIKSLVEPLFKES